MDRRRDQRREVGLDERSSVVGQAERPAQQRLGGGRAQADQDAGLHQPELGLQPGAASRDLFGCRFLVYPPFRFLNLGATFVNNLSIA